MFVSIFTIMLLKQIRDSAYAVWIVLFPPVLYGILALLWPGLAESAALLSVLSLFLAATAGFLNQPLLFAQMREDRMLIRLSVTPLPEWMIPPASALATLAISCSGQLLLITVAFLTGDIPVGSVPGFIASSLFVITAILAVGLWLPVLFGTFLAVKNAGNLVLVVLFASAGIFFRFPDPFSAVHRVNPLYRMYSGLFNAASLSRESTGLLAVGAFMIGLGLLSSVVRFRGVRV